ncbi:MAG: CrcB family protein [Acidimicrobiales bacterium]|jgi:CrcB protein|nr:CrcB family protein [Acidimicrobiales bacterium]MDE0893669.1 CrcB family protein [Acidimicrobiales bacterium]HAZ35724.1 fluoride efflux transporter CrcB [Acidimicrobiaceae bacterium]HIE68287.1 fluoride efflux transporter CrcB [Acidimicrobiia bacterium]HIL48999.1 fluoride efflux transporter CrcB [Acidimicrobiia bacterium]|tara:strand:- start:1546 stop:1875 length:330 start_codon:yes stop_codon:yes gene_type:complete
MLTAIAFIGLAGAGSAIRFLAADRWPGGHRGTLLVNVAGSLLLGLLTGAGAPVPLVVGVGGLGALTTFSTFASDTLALADEGRRRVGGHVAATVVLGLGAALVGLAIGS